jgi:hypothetical protein
MKMNNMVSITYGGEEYIGQIDEIQSVWSESTSVYDAVRKRASYVLCYYDVAIREKDTFLRISGIRINDISEIKLLNP